MAVAENYARIVVGLPWHDKVCALPEKDRLAAFGLYVAAVCFCQKNLTDGRIRKLELFTVFPSEHVKKLAVSLCEVGLMHEHSDSFSIHDYLDTNRSRSEIEQVREARRESGRAGGLAKAKQTASKTEAKVYPDTDTYTDTDKEHQKTEELSTGSRPKCFIDADVDRICSELTAKYGNEKQLTPILDTLVDTCPSNCSGLHTCGVDVALQAITRTRLPSKLPEFIRQERGRA